MIFDVLTNDSKFYFDKIIELPFNRELLSGNLPLETFVFYCLQDKFYLDAYAKALALTAARLGDSGHSKQFLQFAMECMDEEQALHLGYMKKHADIVERLAVNEPSPTCFMYTHFLLQMASTQPIEQAVASLLPCFWLYQQVGEYMLANVNQLQNHPYHDWIEVYSSTAFAASTQAAISVLEELSQSSNNLQGIRQAFLRSTKLEWMFWHNAYHYEQWPI